MTIVYIYQQGLSDYNVTIFQKILKLKKNVNVNFKAMAQEIAKLLDQKETTEKTRGDGKIEGSIWAKYSGTGKADTISQSDAEKVITVDLIERGVSFLQGKLSALGIDWKPEKMGVESSDKLNKETIQNLLKDKQLIKKESYPFPELPPTIDGLDNARPL